MCCPYFDPVEPRALSFDARAAMLPLGDCWSGVCRADPAQPAAIDDAALTPVCNLGYPRGTCVLFPTADGPDAVRFAIAGDGGPALSIRYAIERDHLPFAQGTLACPPEPGAWAGTPGSGALQRQALAYFSSYQRRIREAAGG